MVRDPSGDASSFEGLQARDAAALLTRVLTEAGIEGAARDARLLVLAALGIDGTALVRDPDRRLDGRDAERLSEFARRRAAREPVSRILGERGFYGRTFRITPATLDPRPCTETVIEAALEIAGREGWRERPIRIVDIGTGSGALLLTLLAELPLASGIGTDISPDALAAAQANAVQLGVADRAVFLERRSLDGIDGTFDLLISNPPYIPSEEIASLEADVRAYDPLGALDGGADGLDIYRELAAGFARIVPDGWVLLEIGAGQADGVTGIFRDSADGRCLGDIRLWQDLGQHTRCVAIKTRR
ncbi:peptide chain release factor N(5)-glutamine methyltransferase [Hyphomicrobium sp. LHD-15]|uniref:peptide chain release factor N(5)-glutamine methyltransferase n=1 Tax=Hyphomicrobium sp. LHD-15 TaxID=3072142 RepID=UPI00280C99EC|nr:peptide chain release factor N(5)-glutamine methyltransferase [Hyphomicrobium sp. LHD-15]MDQ8698841.1 peptide chain release factor N(5)-glutamine methyltransferase [Hyphomicrobium sp. LHD-15]